MRVQSIQYEGSNESLCNFSPGKDVCHDVFFLHIRTAKENKTKKKNVQSSFLVDKLD